MMDSGSRRELSAISSIDGRYAGQTRALTRHFSEQSLIQHRINIELAWLTKILPLLAPSLTGETTTAALADIGKSAADDTAAERVKVLESDTKHDVKAIEYWIGEQLDKHQLEELRPYVHFACTSWDINNIALVKQISGAVRHIMLPALTAITNRLEQHITDNAGIAMLARTHGQPASPTTVGKELAVFQARLLPRLNRLAQLRLPAKFNGAVGNYNAHCIAAPQIDWQQTAREFVEEQGLDFTNYTTQIEPYDDLAELFDLLRRINTILLDFCRDCWGYISLDYFIQKTGGGTETGSSTMPHKINPIDFENAEGNIGIANALLTHFSDKLPVSRWQRDLSDSTVLRAIGSTFAHTLIAWSAVAAGIDKISVNHQRLADDLDANWAVLTEAVQTVLRCEGVPDAYEQLKALSRGQPINAALLHQFIRDAPLSEAAKTRLLELKPATYCGLAQQLAQQLVEKQRQK